MMEGCCLSTSANLKRLKALERVEPVEDHGRPFLFFPQRQTYEEALAFAGLVDHEGPVFPIRVVGVKPAGTQCDQGWNGSETSAVQTRCN